MSSENYLKKKKRAYTKKPVDLAAREARRIEVRKAYEQTEKFKESKRQQHKRYVAKPGVKEMNKVRWQKWYAENKEQAALTSAIRHIKRKFRVDQKEAERLYIARERGCELCGSKTLTAIDHCHKTGKIRGILCHNCNQVLGHASDSPATLRALADYLERHA